MSFVDKVSEQKQQRVRDTEGVRARARRLVERVEQDCIARGIRDIEIEVLLACGAACPFHTQWEKDIWVEECNARFYAERSPA